MSTTSSAVIQSPSISTVIDINDPRLNEIIHIDPNSVPLQHGLVYDSDGHVQVKPEIAAEQEPRVLARVARLIAAGRHSEANSIVGCRHIQNVTSYCSDHEAEHAPVICNKPLLHEVCAATKSRIAKFSHEHLELHAHLLQSRFQVLTFTMPPSSTLAIGMTLARERFSRFVAGLELSEFHGWQWLWGYAPDSTTFFAVHEGGGLPAWPELNARWRRIAGPDATLRVRTFDGRDGDTQRDGLTLANSGFRAYWDAVAAGSIDPLVASENLRGQDLTTLHGAFRGFAGTVDHDPDADDATDADSGPSSDAESHLPICLRCGKRHVAAHGTMLLTKAELGQRFDHIRPPSYGQRRKWTYRNYPNPPTVYPSPPPW